MANFSKLSDAIISFNCQIGNDLNIFLNLSLANHTIIAFARNVVPLVLLGSTREPNPLFSPLHLYLSNLEGATAVREVFEETGVRTEFRSLLSIRQQHNHPGAFGMSDMYLICRLSPLTYDIDFCTQECLRCEWLELTELARTGDTTPITSRLAKLLLHGLRHGFHHIDLAMEELPAVYSGLFYQLYHRRLPA